MSLLITYVLQVELVDIQGNPVLRSVETPITFPSAPTQPSIHPLPSTTTTTTPPPPSAPTSLSSTTFTSPSPPVTKELAIHRYTSQETQLLYSTSPSPPPPLVRPWQSPSIPEFVHTQGRKESDKEAERKSQEQLYNFTEEDLVQRDEKSSLATANGGLDVDIVGGEDSAGLDVPQENVYHVTVWCVGVGVGALLLLTLCSMIVWLLNRCRKTTQEQQQEQQQQEQQQQQQHQHQQQQPQHTAVEEYEQQRADALRESLRMYVAQQRNQASSWTFENFCSVARKGRLQETPSEEVGVPVGIDNASLVENYVFMLDTPPPPSFIKR